MTAGSAILTSPGGTFTASDVGKCIQVIGAGPGGLSYSDGAMSAGSPMLTSASASFASTDVGRGIVVVGAGANGANLVTTIQGYTSANSITLNAAALVAVQSAPYFYGAMTLEAHIVSVQSTTSVTLSNQAVATIGPAVFSYGTNNNVAFQNAVDAAGVAGGGQVNVPAPTTCPSGAVCGYVLRPSDVDLTTAKAPAAVKIRYSGVSLMGDSPQTNLFCRGAYGTYTNQTAYGTTGNIRGFCLTLGDDGSDGGPPPGSSTSVSNITISHLHLYGMTNGNTFNVQFGGYPPTTSDGWDITHKAIYFWDQSTFSNITLDSLVIQDFKGENIYSGGSTITGMMITNSTMTNFNGDGISVLAADLTVKNNKISNGSNAGIEDNTAGAATQPLIQQTYSGNTISNIPRHAIVVAGVATYTTSTGSVQILNNTFDTIGQINRVGVESAVLITAQNTCGNNNNIPCTPPANVTVTGNTCHDCYSFGVFNTNGNSFVQGNTMVVDHYPAGNVFDFTYPMTGTTISNNTGVLTANAQASSLGVGSVYYENPGYASGGFPWTQVIVSNNTWNFAGSPEYQFTTTSGLGWAIVSKDNINWQGDTCNGCTYPNTDHGIVNLSLTPVIEPYGPTVLVNGNNAPVTVTVDASKEEDGAQVQIINIGASSVAFSPDGNLSLPSTYTLTSGQSLNLVYRASLSKYTLASAPPTINAQEGNAQSVPINASFPVNLQVKVTDASNNPITGATVTFAAPSAGLVGASFGNSNLATTITNSSGIATAPALTANSITGSYVVTASVAGATASASFSLANTATGTPLTASVGTFGAVADGILRIDGAMTAGSPVLTSPGGTFTVADAGKYIQVVGAGPGGLSYGDGIMSAGSGVLTSGSASFASTDVGSGIVVVGAGANGSNLTTSIKAVTSPNSVTLAAAAQEAVSSATYFYGAMTLEGTIQSVQSNTSITLSTPALATVGPAAMFSYGTDNHVAFQNAVDAAGEAGGGQVNVPAPTSCPSGAVCGYVVEATDQMTAQAPGAVKIRYNGVSLIGDNPQTNLFCRGAYGSYTNSAAFPNATGYIRGFCLTIGDKDGPNGLAGESVSNVSVSHLHLYGMTNGNTYRTNFAFPPDTPDGWDITHKAIYMWARDGSYIPAFANITFDSLIIQDFKGENIFSGGAALTGVVIQNSMLTNFNGDGISMLAAGLQVLNNTISNGSNAGIENSTSVVSPTALVQQVYNGNTISLIPKEGLVIVGVDPGTPTGSIQITNNTFDTIAQINPSGTAAAVQINSQGAGTSPNNVTFSNNKCHDCSTFGIFETSGTSAITNNTFTVDQYPATSVFGFDYALQNITIANNTGSGTANAWTNGNTVGAVYDISDGNTGVHRWYNTILKGNSWNFPNNSQGVAPPQYQFATWGNDSNGEGWSVVGEDNLNWQGDNCTGCRYPDSNHGLVSLANTTTIEPYGPTVAVTGNNAPVTVTVDASKEEDGAQVQIVNAGANPVSFAADSNLSLSFTYTLPGNAMASLTLTYSAAVGKYLLANPAVNLSPNAGTPQSANTNTAFGTNLQVTVTDANGYGVSGATVTFTAPASGASALFGSSSTATALTNASGVATAPTLTANATSGGPYVVTAAVLGVSSSATFQLTNTVGVPATISATAGTPQTANILASFSTPLTATVLDASNHPVGGISVTFTAPSSGASATFSGALSATVATNASGVATAPTLTANGTTGNYSLTGSVPWLSATASFSLNNQDPPGSIAATAGSSQTATENYAFTTALQVLVKDLNNNPLNGATVTFTAPSSGASAAFSGALTTTAVTNASGIATAPALTANLQAGGYSVIASVSGLASTASFPLTNTPPVLSSISATAGSSQSATINKGFATALQATVLDVNNKPVANVTVTFTAPSAGPTAAFGGSLTATAVTNTSGVATAPALTASSLAGGPYSVTAMVSGIATPATFTLTNTPPPPASIVVTAGTSQNAMVTTAFGSVLQATVRDANNNLVNGVSVTFTAPASGASGSFGGSATTTVLTSSNGVATSPTLTANSHAGSYSVTAMVGGSLSATFTLTNVPGPPAVIAAAAGTPQSASVVNNFATALQATVTDSYGNPLGGLTVTFTAPTTGPSATFGTSATATAVTNSLGAATAPNATANGQLGTYTVTASYPGITPSAPFSLTNNPPVLPPGINLIQEAAGSNPGNNQNAMTVTLKSTPIASDVLVLIINHISALQTGTSIGGATWTKVADNYTTNNGDSQIWVGTNPTATTYTITGTSYFGTFQPGYAILAEFSGVSTNLDGSPVLTTSGIWPAKTGTLTTTASMDLLISSTLTYNGGGAGATISGGWTTLATTNASYSLSAAYQVTSAIGSYSATWNGSGSPQVTTILLGLKGSGGVGSIAPTAGAPQSTTVGTGFGTALQATVRDLNNNPISGVSVTFTVPASSGASAAFGGAATATAMTNSNGVATAPTLAANTQAGSYTVTASAPGISTPASFQLTNSAGAPASITPTAGTPQSTTTAAAFTTPLQATVKDMYGNPVSGQAVAFAAPGSAPNASFGGSATATATTNSSGVATAPTLTAGSQTGGYSVTASVASVATPATFLLTNTPPPPGSVTPSSGSSQSVTVGTAFASLQALVKDTNGNPLGGVTVTFTAPSSGASASFGGSATATATTGSNGIATVSALTANRVAGSYSVTAAVTGVTPSASFGLTNLAGSPASIIPTAGTPQSATTNTGFTTTLQATVKDTYGNPVSGQTVTFTAPSSGATATFNSSPTTTAITNSNGVATAPTLTAGSQTGSYFVIASVNSLQTAPGFALTNTPPPPGSITANSGSTQSATVGSSFAALQALVKDINGNPLGGVTVTFTAPSSGAGASFSSSTTASATTNSSGVATAPTLTANTVAGGFSVMATVTGVSGTSFSLTNLPGPPATVTPTAGTPQSAAVNKVFTTALQATVKDMYGNPVSGQTVGFMAPSAGPNASFGASATATAITNSSGVATAPTLTAGSQIGSFYVIASINNLQTTPGFSLTNASAVVAVPIALVQQAAGINPGNNQNTMTVTLPKAPTSTNSLILIFNQVGASQTITISGATWKRISQNYTPNNGDSEIWVGSNPGSTTITITGTSHFGTFQPGYAIVGEFAGVSSMVDGNPALTTSGVWPVTTGSLTTSNANDLLITATLSYSGAGTGATVSNGWKMLNAPSGTYSLSAAYRITSATGSYSATWNGSGTPQVATTIVGLEAAPSN